MKTILINLAILISGVLILELLFGDWWLDNRLFMTRIPRAVQITFDDPGLYEGFSGSKYTRDKYGFRGRYESVDQIDILTVGGSTTDQKYIDDAWTWQEYAAKYIEEESGKSISIVNAGIDGQSTYGHIENFYHWFSFVPRLKPKYLLFYVGLNDKWEGIVPVSGDYTSPVKASRIVGRSENWRNILQKSAFYNAWINAVGYVNRSEGLGHQKTDWATQEWVKLPRDARIEQRNWPHIDAYTKRLAIVIRLTREMGAKPIIVNQRSLHASFRGSDMYVLVPKDWTVENATRIALLERDYAKATMETCEVNGAICVDLYNDLRFKLSEIHFYDLNHSTPEGSELVGNYLGEQLVSRLTW